MLRYVEITEGVFETFCGIEFVQKEGKSSVLTEGFGKAAVVTVEQEWVKIKPMGPWEEAQEKRLLEILHSSAINDLRRVRWDGITKEYVND